MAARVAYLRNATNRSEDVITKVHEVCHTVAQKPIALDRFGSRVYGVFLPLSDADLVIRLNEENESGKELLQKITDHLKKEKGFTAVRNVPIKSTLNFTYLTMKVDLTYVSPGKVHNPTVFTERVMELLNECDTILQHASAFSNVEIEDPCRAFCLLVVDWAKGNDVCYRKGSIGTKMKAVHWVLVACTFVKFMGDRLAETTALEDFLKLFFQFIIYFSFETRELCPFADSGECIVMRRRREVKPAPMYIQGLHDDNLVYHVDETAKALVVEKATAARDEVHKAEFYDNWKNTNWEEEGEWKRNDNPDSKTKWVFEKKVKLVAGTPLPVSTSDSRNTTPEKSPKTPSKHVVDTKNAWLPKPKPTQRPPPIQGHADRQSTTHPPHASKAEPPTLSDVPYAPSPVPMALGSTVCSKAGSHRVHAPSLTGTKSRICHSLTPGVPSSARRFVSTEHVPLSFPSASHSSTPNMSSSSVWGSPHAIATTIVAQLARADDDHQNECVGKVPLVPAAHDSLKRTRLEDIAPPLKIARTTGPLNAATLVKDTLQRALARKAPTLLETTVGPNCSSAKETSDLKTTRSVAPTPGGNLAADKQGAYAMACTLGLTGYVSSPDE